MGSTNNCVYIYNGGDEGRYFSMNIINWLYNLNTKKKNKIQQFHFHIYKMSR